MFIVFAAKYGTADYTPYSAVIQNTLLFFFLTEAGSLIILPHSHKVTFFTKKQAPRGLFGENVIIIFLTAGFSMLWGCPYSAAAGIIQF